MYGTRIVALLALVCMCLAITICALDNTPFMWVKGRDGLGITRRITNSVSGGNCKTKDKNSMTLSRDTVTQIPQFNTLRSKVWYPNRTRLIHLHNMALNRAMFYSFIFQRMNDTKNFKYQPNWQYMYMDVNANVKANGQRLNGSAIIFDRNCAYANWFYNMKFNTTLPLFGAKAWNWNDYRDSGNYLREGTGRSAAVVDLGAGGPNADYTHPRYKMNTWYDHWLPDTKKELDSINKFTYTVEIKYSNSVGTFVHNEYQGFSFFGPGNPGQREDQALPVNFTKVFFDCGNRNQWVLSATAPVVDFMPRYSNFTHTRRPKYQYNYPNDPKRRKYWPTWSETWPFISSWNHCIPRLTPQETIIPRKDIRPCFTPARFVAVISMEMDFNKIDFNHCPVSIGNPGPSFLAGIDRCKKKTTTCKQGPHYNRGFGRGRYVCVCKAGYRYPTYVKPPFQGGIVEKATDQEYKDGFDCTPVQNRQVLPAEIEGEAIDYNDLSILYTMNSTDFGRVKREIAKRSTNKPKEPEKPPKFIPYSDALLSEKQRNMPEHRRRRAAGYDPKAFDRMIGIFRKYDSINKNTCKQRATHDLTMPGDVTFGVETQFEFEARTALRLSHFLCNYLQNVGGSERYGNMMGGGFLHIDHIFGEVLANVMANHRILSSAVYFEENAFVIDESGKRRELFGPLAFRKNEKFFAIDTAGLKKRYTQEDWFLNIKQRWKTNSSALKKYVMKPKVRSDINGTSSVKFEFYPLKYYAPSLKHGDWSSPIFRCDGRVDKWVMTYAIPFFGKEGRKKVAFKGAITVDVPLNALKINQCPMPYHVPNAFKNTAKCHHASTSCATLHEFPWSRGAYRCNCRQGHEYYFRDGKSWFEGSLLEVEWLKKQYGLFSRFDSLYCRVSSAPSVAFSYAAVVLSLLVISVWS